MAEHPRPHADAGGTRELVAASDPRLEPLLRSPEDAREAEIARLIAQVAPLIDGILTRQGRRSPFLRQDAGDIAAVVHFRLLLKLRGLSSSADDAVHDFERYVAGLTYNAIHDHLRAAFPARARLKNRIRYILMRDPRLARWAVHGELVAGLAPFQGQELTTDALLAPHEVTPAMLDASRPGDALAAMLRAMGGPVPLETLIDLAARLWNVNDVRMPMGDVPGDREFAAAPPAEQQTDLHALWREIRALRPMQRKALLLNLRAPESVDLIAVFVRTGVASWNEMADALEQTSAGLAAIWNDLPFDDTAIAQLLGITRQQVINLRKSARERLARRMFR